MSGVWESKLSALLDHMASVGRVFVSNIAPLIFCLVLLICGITSNLLWSEKFNSGNFLLSFKLKTFLLSVQTNEKDFFFSKTIFNCTGFSVSY